MQDWVDSKANAKHDQPTAYPRRPPEGRAKVAYDQKGRYSCDLVRHRYPSCLAAGQRKPTFYCWNCRSDYRPFTAIDSKNAEMHMKKRNQRALARNCRQAGRQPRHPNPVWNLPLLSDSTYSGVVAPLTAVDGCDWWASAIAVLSIEAEFATVTYMVFW